MQHCDNGARMDNSSWFDFPKLNKSEMCHISWANKQTVHTKLTHGHGRDVWRMNCCQTVWTFRNDVDPCCLWESQARPCPWGRPVCVHSGTVASNEQTYHNNRDQFPRRPCVFCGTIVDRDGAILYAELSSWMEEKLQNFLPQYLGDRKWRGQYHSNNHICHGNTSCWLKWIKEFVKLAMAVSGMFTWRNKECFDEIILSHAVYFRGHVQHTPHHGRGSTKTQYSIQMESSNLGIVTLVIGEIKMVWVRFTISLESAKCNQWSFLLWCFMIEFTSWVWTMPDHNLHSRWSAWAECHLPFDLDGVETRTH